MDDALRNSLWNVLHDRLWTKRGFLQPQYDDIRRGRAPEVFLLGKQLWVDFFKLPRDTMPGDAQSILAAIRKHFFSCKWNEVYDLLEFLVGRYPKFSELHESLNEMLERESSGYRIISGTVANITDKEEMEMLEAAVADDNFGSVAAHLRRSLEFLTDREKPDYRNSIKESISAVEAMARIVTNNDSAMLPDALKALEKAGKLHEALKIGFIKLYGYTSDADGIRHAMLEEPNLTAADARFFLLSCTSFSNYLKAHLS